MAWALAGPWVGSGSGAAHCCSSSQLAIGEPDGTDGKARFGTPAWGAAGDKPAKGVNQQASQILAETLVKRGIHQSCAPNQEPSTGKKTAWRSGFAVIRVIILRGCNDCYGPCPPYSGR